MRAPSSSGLASCVAVAALVCATSVPSRAGAEPAARTDQDKEARRLFQKAELGFNLGKFEDALGDYQAAYQAKPLPGFLFNIAQCYRNLGNWERARFFYRRYLTLEPRSPNRRRVEELVGEMTERLDKQQAQAATAVPPPSAVAPPPAIAPPLPEPAVAAPVNAAPPMSLAASTTAAPARRPVYARWWFWAGVGAVVAGGVVAAIVLGRPDAGTPGSLDPIDAR